MPDLNQLKIIIDDHKPVEELRHLNVKKFFGSRRNFRIELDISDSTVSTFSLEFLKVLPTYSEVHIRLRHVPMPNSFFTVESRRKTTLLQLWPETISKLVSTCNHLTHLDLDLNSVCSAEDFQLIVLHCPLLQSLKLCFSPEVTDDGITSLAANCKKLEKVHFKGGNLTDNAIQMIVGESLELTEITLESISNLTNASLEYLSRAVKLRSCHIIGLSGINDTGVNHLIRRVPVLDTLKVSNCEGVSRELLAKLAKKNF